MENEQETHDYKKWERRHQKQKIFYAKWEEKRKHKWKYVLTYGLLTFGLFFFIFTALVEYYDSRTLVLYKVLGRLAMSLVLGIWFGLNTFDRTEKRYREYLIKKED